MVTPLPLLLSSYFPRDGFGQQLARDSAHRNAAEGPIGNVSKAQRYRLKSTRTDFSFPRPAISHIIDLTVESKRAWGNNGYSSHDIDTERGEKKRIPATHHDFVL
jgi:hypothetical protein